MGSFHKRTSSKRGPGTRNNRSINMKTGRITNSVTVSRKKRDKNTGGVTNTQGFDKNGRQFNRETITLPGGMTKRTYKTMGSPKKSGRKKKSKSSNVSFKEQLLYVLPLIVGGGICGIVVGLLKSI